jgi:hypothetical protein
MSNPEIPARGGSYVRERDGALKPVHATEPAPPPVNRTSPDDPPSTPPAPADDAAGES